VASSSAASRGLARLWLCVVAFAGGTAAGLQGRPPWPVGILGAIGAAGLARRRSWTASPCLAAAVLATAWWGTSERAHEWTPVESLAAAVVRCRAVGEVLEGAGGLGTLVALAWVRCDGFAPVASPGVVVMDGAVADAGSSLAAEGWLLPLSDGGFDRARWRLGARAYLDAEKVRARAPQGTLLAVASRVRRGLVASTAALGGERGALLRGLAIGDTSALDPIVISEFRRAGLAHLLAVSGSNVAIVLGTVTVLLSRGSLALRLAGAAAALVLFVLIVGPEPSVLRAAAMGAVGLLALASGRRAEPLHALGLALIGVLGLRPGLVTHVGLHLSVAATAGIVLWSGPLAALLGPLPRVLALGLGATLAAQLAVLPLVAATFGEVSLAGPLANLLAVPAVPPATIAGLGAALVGALYEPAGTLVARAAEPFVGWILWVGSALGRARWASLEVPRALGWLVGVPLAALAVRTVVVAHNGREAGTEL
jgi:ComEC/Rec2-related protein